MSRSEGCFLQDVVANQRAKPSERSDAGISIVQKVFAFVKKNLSGA